MAEGSMNNIILDDFLTCQICFEIYKEPKILKCLHSFCEECLARCIITVKSQKNITCPSCRDISNLPQNGVTSLKSNFYIKNLIGVLNTTSNVNRCQWHCSYCEIFGNGRVNATEKCLSCNDFLCQTCAGNHNGTRMTMNHQVISITDLTAGQFSSHVRSMREIPCPKHAEETMRYLCESCNVHACRDCVLLDHRQHNYVQISEAVRTRKNEIEETLKSLDKRLDSMNCCIQRFDVKLEELSTKELSYIEKVQQTTEVVIQNARKECEMTKQITKEQFIAPKKYIQDLKTAMETKIKDLDDSLKFSRKVIQDRKDAEILFLLGTMIKRLTALQYVEIDKEYLNCQLDVSAIHLTEKFRGGEPIFQIQFPTEINHSNSKRGHANSKINNGKLHKYREESDEVKFIPEVSTDTSPMQIVGTGYPKQPGADRTNSSNKCKEERDIMRKGSPEVNADTSAKMTVGAGNQKQQRTERTTFVLSLVRQIDLLHMKEKCSPKITCVCDSKDNTFYAVDCNNSELLKYSYSGEYILSTNVKNVITVAKCESFLACGFVNGKISTISENGTISDTDIPILNRTPPMCSARNDKSVIVMTTDRFFEITKRQIKETYLKRQGNSCHISPKSLSNFKNSQYIVSDLKSKSLLFIEDNGTIFKDYRHENQHWMPGGITSDNSDYIYVVCLQSCSLQILNPDAIHVQTINLKPNVSDPQSVSFVGDGRIGIGGSNGITVYKVKCDRK